MSEFSQLVLFALDAIWKVALVGVVLGAGLPALFAVGVRSLAWGAGGNAELSHAGPNPMGKPVAILIFAVVAYAVITGILYIIASGQGMTISVSSVIPTFVEKD